MTSLNCDLVTTLFGVTNLGAVLGKRMMQRMVVALFLFLCVCSSYAMMPSALLPAFSAGFPALSTSTLAMSAMDLTWSVAYQWIGNLLAGHFAPLHIKPQVVQHVSRLELDLEISEVTELEHFFELSVVVMLMLLTVLTTVIVSRVGRSAACQVNIVIRSSRELLRRSDEPLRKGKQQPCRGCGVPGDASRTEHCNLCGCFCHESCKRRCMKCNISGCGSCMVTHLETHLISIEAAVAERTTQIEKHLAQLESRVAGKGHDDVDNVNFVKDDSTNEDPEEASENGFVSPFGMENVTSTSVSNLDQEGRQEAKSSASPSGKRYDSMDEQDFVPPVADESFSRVKTKSSAGVKRPCASFSCAANECIECTDGPPVENIKRAFAVLHSQVLGLSAKQERDGAGHRVRKQEGSPPGSPAPEAQENVRLRVVSETSSERCRIGSPVQEFSPVGTRVNTCVGNSPQVSVAAASSVESEVAVGTVVFADAIPRIMSKPPVVPPSVRVHAGMLTTVDSGPLGTAAKIVEPANTMTTPRQLQPSSVPPVPPPSTPPRSNSMPNGATDPRSASPKGNPLMFDLNGGVAGGVAGVGSGGDGGGDNFYCCQCGVEVESSSPVCVLCPHRTCRECREEATYHGHVVDQCVCHFATIKDETSDGNFSAIGADAANKRNSDSLLADCLAKFAQVVDRMAPTEQTNKYRSTLRVPASATFPKGTEARLSDVPSYLREFSRVCRHVAGGGDNLDPFEKVTHLVSCWPEGERVGRAMRLRQSEDDYLKAEEEGKGSVCWDMLVEVLKKKAAPAALCRRQAQDNYKSLKQRDTETIAEFHIRWDECLLDLKRYNAKPGADQLLVDYLDRIVTNCAKHLEYHVNPTTLEAAQAGAESWSEIEQAYTAKAGGLRTRVVWDSARKQMQAPLQDSQGNPVAAKVCGECKGVGHSQNYCPSLAAAKDPAFKVSDKPCSQCGGAKHWARHHQSPSTSSTTPTTEIKKKPCVAFQKGKCKFGKECRYSHDATRQRPQQDKDPAQNVNKQGNGNDSNSKKPCHLFQKTGSCKYGAKCRFSHDKSGTQRQTGTDGATTNSTTSATAPSADGKATVDQNLVVYTNTNRSMRVVDEDDDSDGDDVGRSLAVRIGNQSVASACQLVNFDLLDLKYVNRPAQGYHMFSHLLAKGTDEKLRVVWDSGAEGTTISANCASRVMRAQRSSPEPEALVDLGRYRNPQTFYGFSGSKSTKVDVQGYLRLQTMDGYNLPELLVRIVPDQHDDILIAAPDLDRLGWERRNDCFLLTEVGISISREASNINRRTAQLDEDGALNISNLRVSEELVLDPFSYGELVCRLSGSLSGAGWFVPKDSIVGSGIEIPEGPVDDGDYVVVPVANRTAEIAKFPVDAVVGEVVVPKDDEEEIMILFEELGRKDDVPAVGRKEPTTKLAKRSSSRVGDSFFVIVKWFMLVMGVLAASRMACIPEPQAPNLPESVMNNSSYNMSDFKYHDFSSVEYQDAVVAELDSIRQKQYNHLSEEQYQKLRNFVRKNAVSFYIDGSAPTTVNGYQFDIQLQPGAVPSKATVPKYSLTQARKEAHHIDKEMKLGHLRTPTEEQLSEWTTKVHTVYKKEDEFGRLVCDFRLLNKATIKKPIQIGCCFEKARAIAGKRWKTAFDALYGFNQIKATENASRLMTIVTAQGLRQWTVCPFGVTNGPSYFQHMMQHLFSKQLGEGMQDLDSQFEVFMDDGCLGTGTVDSSKPGDNIASNEDREFDKHLEALQRILSVAQSVNLRLKLSKCHFCQFAVDLLGMHVGVGVVSPDSKKVDALVNWPRPNRREDVERFLASCSYIRQHLTPKFSDISKPLREVLTELQESRSKGLVKTRKVPKGTPPAEAKGDDPPWWGEEQKNSFDSIKKAVKNAVLLNSPDVQGGADGSNPYHLYVDACAYGVGAGLFQASVTEGVKEDSRSLYEVLGVTTWSTKAEVVKAYHEKRRNLVKMVGHNQSAATVASLKSDLKLIEDAFAVLSDTAKRTAYDAANGLPSRKARLDLKPLGFFSKSLSPAQRSWTTWERELLAVVESLIYFSGMTRGCKVITHTDHLNNTVINQNLRSPDRILRMLLKVESLCHPQYIYLPGRSNTIGDGFSRNPPDRDLVRDEFEAKAHVPKTLSEMFALIADSKNSTDDGDWIVNAASRYHAFVSRAAQASDQATSTATATTTTTPLATCSCRGRCCCSYDYINNQQHPKPEAWLRVCGDLPSFARTAKVSRGDVFPALFVPSFLEESDDTNSMLDLTVTGVDCQLKVEAVLTPQVGSALGVSRWLEPFQKGPWSKKDLKKGRLMLADGVLALLRSIRDGMFVSVIAQGEGGIVASAMLNNDFRSAAYKERHVAPNEAQQLEEAYSIVKHVLLFAAHSFPPKSYFALLKEQAPELACTPIAEDKTVISIIPLNHSVTEASKAFSKTLVGAVEVTVPWSKPLKTIPQPLKLDVFKKVPLFENLKASVPKKFIECFAGSASLSKEVLRFGFTVRAFEKVPVAGETLPEGDLSRPENIEAVVKGLLGGEIFQAHFAPDCATFGSLWNLCKTATRTNENLTGDGSNEKEILGNQGMAIAFALICVALGSGVFWSFEHPLRSKVWRLPFMVWLVSLPCVYVIDYDGCAHGLRPSDWHSADGDVRTQKSSRIITTNPMLEILRRKCGDSEPHKHEQVIGSDGNGLLRSRAAAAYSQSWCQLYAQAMKRSYHQGMKPDVPAPWLMFS